MTTDSNTTVIATPCPKSCSSEPAKAARGVRDVERKRQSKLFTNPESS
jgi:hypothetical protein